MMRAATGGGGRFVHRGIVIEKRKMRSLMAKMMLFPQTAPDDDTSKKAKFTGGLCIVSHRTLPEGGLGVARKRGEENRE
ncbi:hypothetical protein ACLOJK_037329 [Asimina triloba]